MRIALLLFFFFLTISGFSQFSREFEISNAVPNPDRIFSFDINADNQLDVVMYGVAEDRLYWLEGMGNGEYKEPRVLVDSINYNNVGPLPGVRLDFKDIDGDGLKDLITNAAWYEAGWFKNYGNGNFGEVAATFNVPTYPRLTYVEDFDNDGLNDLMVGYPDNEIYFVKNNGGGNFANPVNVLGSQLLYNLVEWDFFDKDGDNDLDFVALSHTTDRIISFVNDGNAVFTTNEVVLDPTSPKLVKHGDFINNGVPANCIISNDDNMLRIKSQTGFEFYSTQIDASWNIQGLFVEDVNNDNLVDIIVANYQGDSWLFTNNGAYNFTQSIFTGGVHLNGGYSMFSDVNNDGFEDYFFADGSLGNLTLWPNNSGSLSDSLEILDASANGDFDFADFNGDGKMDIVATAYSGLKIYLNQNGEMNLVRIDGTDLWDNQRFLCAAGDMDGDNDQDIVFVRNDSIYVLRNDSLGVNWSTWEVSANDVLSHYTIQVADLDNDSDLDILIYGYWDILWIENQGNMAFGPAVPINVSNDNVSCVPFDYDSDGDLDILTTHYTNTMYVIHKNNGGSFSMTADTLYDLGGYQVIQWDNFVTYDYDSDGDEDILHFQESGSPDYYNLLFLENTNGSFSNSGILLDSTGININSHSIGMFDVDDDQVPDLVMFSPTIQSTGGALYWAKNNGNGFEDVIHFADFSDQIFKAQHVDIDNDTDQDLYINCGYGFFGLRNVLYSPWRAMGTIYFDENQNGVRDSLEVGVNSVLVASDIPEHYSYNNNGKYFVDYLTDSVPTNIIAPILNSNWIITSDSLSYNVIFDSLQNIVDSLDFGIYPDSVYASLSGSITSSQVICDESALYWLTISNEGTTIVSGDLVVTLDPEVQFVTSTPQPDSVNGSQLYYGFDSLLFYSDLDLEIEVAMPNFAFMGTEMNFNIEATLDNNSGYLLEDSLHQYLLCAYDPNDKIALPLPNENDEISVNTKTIDYTIRFQNTGNYIARDVIVVDTLSNYLKRSTIRDFSSSHPMTFELQSGGVLTVNFLDINLPDTSVSFTESQGFVRFRVDLNDNLELGSVIENTGFIYFDQNPAIVTNTTRQVLSDFIELPEIEEGAVIAYPNPTSGAFTIYYNSESSSLRTVQISDYTGRIVKTYQDLNQNVLTIPAGTLNSNMYLVRCVTDEGDFTVRMLVE